MIRVLKAFVFAVLIALAALILLWQISSPGLDPYQAGDSRLRATDAPSVELSWLGVSAVLIRDGDSAVMIDPFFSRPGFLHAASRLGRLEPNIERIQAWLKRLGVKRLDAVAVSHSHYDHAMDAGVVAVLTGAVLLGSPSTLNIGRGAGLEESRLIAAEDEDIAAGRFRLRFINSAHAGATGGFPAGKIAQTLVPPPSVLDYKLGATYSILVTHVQGTLLHHGSAGFVENALQGVQADAVLLGVALIDDMPQYLAQVVDMVGAKTVYPVHWDDFTRPFSQPLRPMPVFVRLDKLNQHMAKRPDLSLRSLPLAKPIELF